MSRKRALFILAEGFEELEVIAPVDLLRRAGVEVVMASRDENLTLTGRNGIHLSADLLLPTALESEYDIVVLPGGPGHKLLRSDKRVLATVKSHEKKGALIGAICAAPTVLKDAGLLGNRRYTAHHSVAEELTAILKNEAVVVDRNVVTSRGAGTAIEFGLSLVAQLVGPEKAGEIARDIHFRPEGEKSEK